jgi:hypothetical protein
MKGPSPNTQASATAIAKLFEEFGGKASAGGNAKQPK